MRDTGFWKFLIVLNGVVPPAMLMWDAAQGQLGANPGQFALHSAGMLALIFLMLTLAVTPFKRLFGWNFLPAYRRTLGLFAFFYACLHLAIYYVWDRQMNFRSTIHEILGRFYLQVGLAALIVMVPLAATSTNAMIKRLGGKNWKRLHKLTYAAALLGVLHFYLQVKSDIRLPLIFAGILTALLGARAAWAWLDARKKSKRALKPATP